jgi:hypothetical protein
MMLHKGPQSRIPHCGSRFVFCALFALTSILSLSLPAFAGADDLCLATGSAEAAERISVSVVHGFNS